MTAEEAHGRIGVASLLFEDRTSEHRVETTIVADVNLHLKNESSYWYAFNVNDKTTDKVSPIIPEVRLLLTRYRKSCAPA